MGLLSFLFGKPKNNISDYINKGAVILDVRTAKEYKANHIPEALHIPLAELESRLEELTVLNKPVIAHCASGVRSAQAARLLKSYNIDAINGGGIAKVKAALG